MKKIGFVVAMTFGLFAALTLRSDAQSTYDDEFSSSVLDTKWLWIDPNGDCSWSLTDYPGNFTFTVPDGNDLFWYENYDAPRLVQWIRGNFVAETKMNVKPGDHAFKGGGLLLWDDVENWLFVSRDNSYYRQQVQITGNLNSDQSRYAVHMDPYTPTEVHFKVHRYAYDFTFSYSGDGTTWNDFPPVHLKTSDSLLVGLVAFFTDYDSIGGTTVAQFDYFRVIEAGFSPCVLIDDISVKDSTGNNNGQADIGETIQLNLHVSNWGIPADEIWTQLSCENPSVTIPNDLNLLGDLIWNEKTSSSFLATIDFSCLADTIPFAMTFYNDDFSNEDSFKVHLNQPDLTLADVLIDDSNGNNDGRTDSGETAQYFVTVSNHGDVTAKDITAWLECQEPGITIVQDRAYLGDIDVGASSVNTLEPFVVAADTGLQTHDITFSLQMQSTEYYMKKVEFTTRVGRADILLMKDCWAPYQHHYTASLDSVNFLCEYWDLKSSGIPSFDLSIYNTIIWFTGNERDSTITPEEQALLSHYLEEGGHLIISGENIGYDLAENGSEDDFHFYANYLHADYLGDTIDETFLSGVEGDPISGEFTLFTLDVSQTSPSVIAPREGATPILVYYTTGDAAGIKYEGNSKVVYFAFGLEGLRATSGDENKVRGALLDNIIRWFNYVPKKGDVNQDGRINIMDVLMTVNIVLGVVEPTPSQNWAADCNEDAIMNIMDVIGIVNVVLGIGTCPPTGATKITPSVVEYLQSLTTHLSPDDVARLMALVTKVEAPAEYHLSQNYPNPFNPVTSIEFALPWTTETNLSIYNILGQEVEVLIDGQIKAGYHRFEWDASGMASGIYFYRLTTDDFISTKRMVLMR